MGTGTQVQCCVAIVIPTVFHPRLDISDPYPYPYPWYPYPWYRTRTHTHIYGLVPIPVPVPMTLSPVIPVPIPVPMVSYPYPYPYPWSRTRTCTHTHGLVPIPVPVPMIRTHTTSLAFTLISVGLIRYSCGHISGPHEPIPTKFGLWMFSSIMLHQYMVSKTLKCKKRFFCVVIASVLYMGKLGNGKHLSLEAYKYKENNIYVIIIM